MDPDAIATVFTLLILAGLGGVATVYIASGEFRRELEQQALALAALVATGATLGSLYFSEVAGFMPCKFCWYQRVAMYPLALILIIAAARHDRGIRPYAGALAALGGTVSIYHYQLQAFPGQGSSCTTGVSCTFRWIELLGFVSIPLLALGCFALILMLVWMMPTSSGRKQDAEIYRKALHE